MRISNENTFVYLVPDDKGKDDLINHYKNFKEVGVLNILKHKDYHCTLLDYWIPIEIPADFSSRRFFIKKESFYHRLVKNKIGNKYSLILCFHNYGIKMLHKELLMAYPSAKFNKSLLQHITISYNVDKIDLDKISLPNFDLSLGDFSGSEAINTDDLENLTW